MLILTVLSWYALIEHSVPNRTYIFIKFSSWRCTWTKHLLPLIFILTYNMQLVRHNKKYLALVYSLIHCCESNDTVRVGFKVSSIVSVSSHYSFNSTSLLVNNCDNQLHKSILMVIFTINVLDVSICTNAKLIKSSSHWTKEISVICYTWPKHNDRFQHLLPKGYNILHMCTKWCCHSWCNNMLFSKIVIGLCTGKGLDHKKIFAQSSVNLGPYLHTNAACNL